MPVSWAPSPPEPFLECYNILYGRPLILGMFTTPLSSNLVSPACVKQFADC